MEFNELLDNPTVRRIFGFRCRFQQKSSSGTQGNQFSRPVAASAACSNGHFQDPGKFESGLKNLILSDGNLFQIEPFGSIRSFAT
jgi:hypothetical protein